MIGEKEGKLMMAIPPAWREPLATYLLSEFEKRYPDQDRDFAPSLHRLIQAFVMDALRPWRQAFMDAAMITAGPLRIPPGLDPGPAPYEFVELWRGEFRGEWLRLCAMGRFRRLELQRETTGDTDMERQSWSVEWSR